MHTSGRKPEDSMQVCSLVCHAGRGARTQISGLVTSTLLAEPLSGPQQY